MLLVLVGYPLRPKYDGVFVSANDINVKVELGSNNITRRTHSAAFVIRFIIFHYIFLIARNSWLRVF